MTWGKKSLQYYTEDLVGDLEAVLLTDCSNQHGGRWIQEMEAGVLQGGGNLKRVWAARG